MSWLSTAFQSMFSVLLFLLSEDQAQRIGLARGGDHEDDVVLL